MSLIKNVMREGDKNQFEALLLYFQKNAEELQQAAKDNGGDIVLRDIDGLSEPFNSVLIAEDGFIAFPAPANGYHYEKEEGSGAISTSFDLLKNIEFFTGTKDYQINTDEFGGMLYASDTKDNDFLQPLHQKPIFQNMNGVSADKLFNNLHVNPQEFVPSIEAKLDEIKQQTLGNDVIEPEIPEPVNDVIGPEIPELAPDIPEPELPPSVNDVIGPEPPDIYKSLLQIKEEFNRDIDALSKSIDEKWLTIEGDEDYKNSKEELKGYVNNARDYGNSSIDVMNSIEGAKVSGLYYDKDAVSNEARNLMDNAYKEAKEGFEEVNNFQKGLTEVMSAPQKTPLIKYVATEAIAALGTRSFSVHKSEQANQLLYGKLHHCATLQTKMLDLSIKYEKGNIFTKPLYKAQFKVLSAALDNHLKIAEAYREKAIECGEKAIKRLGAIDNFLEKHGMLSENLLDKKIDMAITQNIILDYKKEMDNTRDNNVDIVEFAHRVANNEITHISSPETARAKFEQEVAIPLAKKIKEESSEAEAENEMDDQELE